MDREEYGKFLEKLSKHDVPEYPPGQAAPAPAKVDTADGDASEKSQLALVPVDVPDVAEVTPVKQQPQGKEIAAAARELLGR